MPFYFIFINRGFDFIEECKGEVLNEEGKPIREREEMRTLTKSTLCLMYNTQ